MKNKIERPYEKDKFFKIMVVGLSERAKKNYRNRFQPWFDFVGWAST
jgi:hypothetical protein